MAIKHVLLDLDDTVFDFHRSEREAIGETLSHFGVCPNDETVKLYSDINRSCWQALERGEMSREQILVKRFELLFEALNVRVAPDLVREYYEDALSRSVHIIDGAMELIHALRQKYSVSIASNGTARVQDERLRRSGIVPLFDNIFISEKLGANKPSEKFFDLCLKALAEEKKDSVIIVGDSLTSDISGGVNFGIHTCLYNPCGAPVSGNIIPEYEARTLDEIPKIIESIK